MQEIENIPIQEIRSEIIKFNNDLSVQKLKNLYATKSYSEILGVNRKELAHSSFLAWLLNDSESHSLGKYPIRKFLEILVVWANKKQLHVYKGFFDSVLVADYELWDINVKTEKSIHGVGRIDIFIETNVTLSDQKRNLKIIIENKVGAKEQKDQTSRYYEFFNSNKQQDDIVLYVYLTPISSLKLEELAEPECSSINFIQINYQSLVDYIIEPALNRNISDLNKTILGDYVNSLRQPSLSTDEDYKQELIMALGTEERELLTKFWNKNNKLILAALYAISSDPDQDEDVRENATSALSKLSNSSKDRSRYSIFYNNNNEYKEIKKSDIGLYTVKVLEKNDLLNDEIIEFLKNEKSSGLNLIKKIDEVTEKDKKYRVGRNAELLYNNQGYYVVRNWGIGNIGNFIKNMEEKFPNLTYEKHDI